MQYACARQRRRAQSQSRELHGNVVPVFLPLYSPELNPIERLWCDLKDKLAAIPITIITELSDALGTIIQQYSHGDSAIVEELCVLRARRRHGPESSLWILPLETM